MKSLNLGNFSSSESETELLAQPDVYVVQSQPGAGGCRGTFFRVGVGSRLENITNRKPQRVA